MIILHISLQNFVDLWLSAFTYVIIVLQITKTQCRIVMQDNVKVFEVTHTSMAVYNHWTRLDSISSLELFCVFCYKTNAFRFLVEH